MTDRVAGRIANHPTVRKVLANKAEPPPAVIDADWLREICLSAGADDVAFASVENPALAFEREHVDSALPGAKSFISLVVRMNRDNVRSPARSVANQEFHRTGEIINEAAHRITRALQDVGHRALNPSATFPHGDGPVSRPDLGGRAQTRRCGVRAGGGHGHPPQRDSSEVRKLHPVGHHPGRRPPDHQLR